MLLALAFLAAPIHDADPLASPDAWMPVPVFVREELGSETWVRNDYRLYMGGLVDAGFMYQHGAPVVWVEGRDASESPVLEFRFDVSPKGDVSVFVTGWRAIGGEAVPGLVRDLSGRVYVEQREAGSTEPLRLEFRLFGGNPTVEDVVLPVLFEGAVELPAETVPWNAALTGPELPTQFPPPGGGRLDHVQLDWANGEVRVQGHIDELGRRQGTWTAHDVDGSMMHRAHFLNGEAIGTWQSFSKTGALFESGSLVFGYRHGYWQRRQGSDTTGGLMLSNVPHGTWRSHTKGGRLTEIRHFELGRRVGTHQQFFSNGQLAREQTFGDDGRLVAERYWDVDGEPLERLPGVPANNGEWFLRSNWLENDSLDD